MRFHYLSVSIKSFLSYTLIDNNPLKRYFIGDDGFEREEQFLKELWDAYRTGRI